MLDNKERQRITRHRRIRKKLAGTKDRLRLCVHRSLNNLHAQIIDDSEGKVLAGMSTTDNKLREQLKSGGNKRAAELLGQAFAAMAVGKGFKKMRFDRGGYAYHGRVKAFADSARKGGLEF